MISKKELRYISSLNLKKFRNENKKYLVEGKRLIIEGLKAGLITDIYYCPEKCSFNNFSKIKFILLKFLFFSLALKR